MAESKTDSLGKYWYVKVFDAKVMFDRYFRTPTLWKEAVRFHEVDYFGGQKTMMTPADETQPFMGLVSFKKTGGRRQIEQICGTDALCAGL